MSSDTTYLKKQKLRNRLRSAFLIASLWAAVAFFQASYEFAILASYNVSPGMRTYLILVQSSVPAVFIAGFLAGFLFLDIRSSTTIAEQLEEVQYFEFVKDFFQDVTPAILATKGEAYQYVGDEIVVSWPLDKGLRDNNCIHAFFEALRSIRGKVPHYQQKYGVSPSFKVGLHCGTVVTGEIGVIKRDIAHSGDVLNTAARIQSKCNELG
ncbi:MAG: adenylate/guanylate cyclase domain-containing protein [Phaeodactylibacter sp.]|nr:adenylate/guanylate cyclase domain-containing protein [Phaeodactylibacter sp.]